MTAFQKVVKYCAIALAAVIIVGIFSGLYGLGSLIFGIADLSKKPEEQTVTSINPEGEFLNLDIDIIAASLTIKSGESFKAETDCEYVTLSQKGSTLLVTEKKHKTLGNDNIGDITIILPENHNLKKAEIETGAGKIDISSLICENLDMELGAGEVKLNNLSVSNKADIDGGAGVITVSLAEINNLELDMGIGELDLTARLIGKNSVNCGVGEAKLNLLGSDEDYIISVDKGIGNATLNGEAMQSGIRYGKGENSLDIDGGIGEIKIEFKAE